MRQHQGSGRHSTSHIVVTQSMEAPPHPPPASSCPHLLIVWSSLGTCVCRRSPGPSSLAVTAVKRPDLIFQSLKLAKEGQKEPREG